MSIDPYSTPAADFTPVSRPSEAAITQGVIQQLARTKPWVRFMSVMVFIGAGLMILAALLMLVIGGLMSGQSNGNPIFSGGLRFGLAAFYVLFACVYIYPGIKLWKYASRIGDLVQSGNAMDLESALNEQRSFWKFLGIVILVILSIYVLVIIGSLAVGAFGAMAAKGA